MEPNEAIADGDEMDVIKVVSAPFLVLAMHQHNDVVLILDLSKKNVKDPVSTSSLFRGQWVVNTPTH